MYADGINQSKDYKDDYNFPFKVPLITIHKHSFLMKTTMKKGMFTNLFSLTKTTIQKTQAL